MSVIAPKPADPSAPAASGQTQPQANPAIPGAAPGAKFVESAEDLKSAENKSADVNPHPSSSEEADDDARKVAAAQGKPATEATKMSSADVKRATERAAEEETERQRGLAAQQSSTPHRGNRNG